MLDGERDPDDWLIETAPRLADPALVGHKFARQAELLSAGFPVPVFVCIPAPAFDVVVLDTLGDGGIRDDADLDADVIAQAEALNRRVRAATVPEALLTQLDKRFDEIAGPAGLVAVRACGVPGPSSGGLAEDSAQDPFAGMSASFLYVRRGELAEKVAACWASAFSPQAAAYRARRGLDPLGGRIAVGVQRMALGTRSFVAFSRDPRANSPRDGSRRNSSLRNGNSRVVIAAAYGIGEGVVQEKADIDHFFVDRVSGDVEAVVTVKSTAVGLDPSRPEAGPVTISVDEPLAEAPVLNDEEIHRVSDLVLRVEEHYGLPQDIEGTFTPDGRIHLVQARPIAAEAADEGVAAEQGTGLERPDEDLTDDQNADDLTATALWDNNNVTESFPHVSSALTYSVARDLYEVGFGDLYRRMGVPARTLRRNAPLLRGMIGFLEGRVYYRLDAWYRLHAQIRCFRPLWSTWEQSLGLASTTPAAPPRGVRRLAAALMSGYCYAEIVARLARHPRRIREFLRWWDGYHPRFADAALLSPQEAVELYGELWTQVGRRWGVTLTNGVFLFATTRTVTVLMKRWLPGADRSLLNGLLCGGPDNRSAKALNSLIALAEAASAAPELRAAVLADTEPQQLWHELTSGVHGDRFAAKLTEHIRKYGDRALHDLKIEAVTPRDQPWTILSALRAYIGQGTNIESIRRTAQATRREAEQELRTRCRNPLRRTAFRSLMRLMRYLTKAREDTRFCRSQLIGDTRALLLRLGGALAESGRLERASDVLDLTVSEVIGAFNGTLVGADLRGLASVRAAERERWSQLPPLPSRLRTRLGVPLADALSPVRDDAARKAEEESGREVAPEARNVLTGLASSSGVVRGRAKVVLDPATSAEECTGRILIARETDPGWLFLMMSAKALVVERGTLLSHTAITGRLLGVPTVVAVAGATTAIPDGSMVEVDGSTGTVRVLQDAQ